MGRKAVLFGFWLLGYALGFFAWLVRVPVISWIMTLGFSADLAGALITGFAGSLVMLQGIAEIVRCVVCLKTGEWPERLKDAEEIDVVEEQLSGSTYVDQAAVKEAIAKVHEIDEVARQRGMGGDTKL